MIGGIIDKNNNSVKKKLPIDKNRNDILRCKKYKSILWKICLILQSAGMLFAIWVIVLRR